LCTEKQVQLDFFLLNALIISHLIIFVLLLATTPFETFNVALTRFLKLPFLIYLRH